MVSLDFKVSYYLFEFLRGSRNDLGNDTFDVVFLSFKRVVVLFNFIDEAFGEKGVLPLIPVDALDIHSCIFILTA